MLTFAAAVFFLIVTPGPGVLSLAGVGAAFGRRAGLRYLVGLFVGTNLVCLGVLTGVAATALADPRIRTVLLVASTAYLLWLAWGIATAGREIRFTPASHPPGIRGGLALQALNPKAYVVNTTLFTGFAIAPAHPAWEVAVKLAILNAIWMALHLGWLWAGIAVQRMDLPPGVQRGVNVGMATAMVAVVALAGWAALA
ncbi:LysE family translocator [Jannaschia sp. LMIT008]|uniref:LysE family translocator n=1 Tax=Jannaschia maritima TaxID=3032585 RepID=UPI002811B56A|nr:LysE family translocator [Jannaschia sp. LMIT008]